MYAVIVKIFISTRGDLKMMTWIEKYKTIIIGVLIIIVITFIYITQRKESEMTSNTDFSIVEKKMNMLQEEKINSPPEKKEIFVDIKGAVQHPGLYEAEEGERVADLIHKAGGLLKEADENLINFALKVEDEMVIYIPIQGEEVEFPLENPSSQNSENKININKANNAELETLPGIGPSKAETIIKYREQHGLFEQIEDIQNISGIGEKTFEKLKDKITIK